MKNEDNERLKEITAKYPLSYSTVKAIFITEANYDFDNLEKCLQNYVVSGF